MLVADVVGLLYPVAISLFIRPSSVNILPRYLNSLTCLRFVSLIFMLRVPGVLLTFIVSVLLTLIFISYSLHAEFKLEVCSWRRSPDSCARLWSAAKSNSLRASGSKGASFVILSVYMMNNNDDNTQPCLTPDVMSNQSVSPSDVRTALILFAYMARMLSNSWPWMLYSSDVYHSLSLFALSNAFSWSTNTMFSSLSCSITFSLSCLKVKIASVQPLPFLKPICAWLRNGSALYLAQEWFYFVPCLGMVLLCTLLRNGSTLYLAQE